MLGYILLTGMLATGLFLLYCFINGHGMISRFFKKILTRDTNIKHKKQLSRFYFERFREHRASDLNKNLIIQILPWLVVLSLVFILGNQYIYMGTVLSGSMEPVFKKGDLVLMQTLDKEPEIGDIIMISVTDAGYFFTKPVTHRVVRIEYDYVITRGDANPSEDPWKINKDNIMGKAVTTGKQPVVIKGLGAILVPEAGEFSIMTKLSNKMGFTLMYQQFRALQPIIIFFATIFYFFILIETRMGNNRRFSRNGRNGAKKGIEGSATLPVKRLN